jgi:hypothetical protein
MEIPREERHTTAPLEIHRWTIQIILPRSRVNYMVDHQVTWGDSKTLDKVRQRYYWLQAGNNVEKWCRQFNTYAASRGPQQGIRGQIHQYNVGAPFKRMVIDVAGPFPQKHHGNRYLLIVMDYFTKWQEAYTIPVMRLQQWRMCWLPPSSATSE